MDGIIEGLIVSREASPPPVRGWNKAVTPAVESMIQHCLELDPARRYQTGHELQEDIERHLSNCPLKYARERSYAERSVKWLRRHPAMSSTPILAVLVLLSLALICSASWVVVRDARYARARLNYLAFHQDFERAQLLLNTVHDSSQGHLLQGIQLAVTCMSPYLGTGTGEPVSARDLHYLPGDVERALRGELTELVMLEVRARVALAEREGPEASAGRCMIGGSSGSNWLAVSTRKCPPRSIRTVRVSYLHWARRRGEDRPGAGCAHGTPHRSRSLSPGDFLAGTGETRQGRALLEPRSSPGPTTVLDPVRPRHLP